MIPDKIVTTDWILTMWNMRFIVGCQGVVHIGGLVQGSPGSVPQRFRLVSFFYWEGTNELILRNLHLYCGTTV